MRFQIYYIQASCIVYTLRGQKEQSRAYQESLPVLIIGNSDANPECLEQIYRRKK
jgi:hypothetical protein